MKRAPQGGRPGKGRPHNATGGNQRSPGIPLPAAPLRHIIGADDPDTSQPEKIDAPAASGKPLSGASNARAGGDARGASKPRRDMRPSRIAKPRRAEGRGRATDRKARSAGGTPRSNTGKPRSNTGTPQHNTATPQNNTDQGRRAARGPAQPERPGTAAAGAPPLRRQRRRFNRPPKHDSQTGESAASAKSSGPPVAPIALPTGPQRLQKVLAAAGVGSRRRCEELIVDGRIEVDRELVTVLGTRVDPATQEIRVDGTALSRPKRVYYVVNKPLGVVSTNYDPAGRSRVIDLVHAGGHRVYTVGRLDRTSEGLILVTNDGELANRLMHPRYGVAKTYLARVAGVPSDEVLEQLTGGVHLAEGTARAERVVVRSTHGQSALLEIVLREGRNREVRRILARVGHKVLELKRIAFGPLRLKDLEPGENRRLTTAELRDLRYAARLGSKEKSGKDDGGKEDQGKNA